MWGSPPRAIAADREHRIRDAIDSSAQSLRGGADAIHGVPTEETGDTTPFPGLHLLNGFSPDRPGH